MSSSLLLERSLRGSSAVRAALESAFVVAGPGASGTGSIMVQQEPHQQKGVTSSTDDAAAAAAALPSDANTLQGRERLAMEAMTALFAQEQDGGEEQEQDDASASPVTPSSPSSLLLGAQLKRSFDRHLDGDRLFWPLLSLVDAAPFEAFAASYLGATVASAAPTSSASSSNMAFVPSNCSSAALAAVSGSGIGSLVLLDAAMRREIRKSSRSSFSSASSSSSPSRQILDAEQVPVGVSEPGSSQPPPSSPQPGSLAKTDHAKTLLRGSSALTKLLRAFASSDGIGREWLIESVGPVVERVLRNEHGNFEINPDGSSSSSSAGSAVNVDANIISLVAATDEVLKAIVEPGVAGTPLPLRVVASLLAHHVTAEFGSSRSAPSNENKDRDDHDTDSAPSSSLLSSSSPSSLASLVDGAQTASQPSSASSPSSTTASGPHRNAVQAFLFLRFIVPFIVTPDTIWPELFDARVAGRGSSSGSRGRSGPAPAADADTRRQLVLLGRAVQQAVNGVEFSQKDGPFMRLNPCLRRHFGPVNSYLEALAADDTQALFQSIQWTEPQPSPRVCLDALNSLFHHLGNQRKVVCQDLEKAGSVDLAGSVAGLTLRLPGAKPPLEIGLLPLQPLSAKDLEAEQRYREALTRAAALDFADCRQTGALTIPGLDADGRPAVVFRAAALDVQSLDMEKFFLFLVQTLDSVVERDYVFVYHHTNMDSKHRPSFSFLKQCYSMFNRKFKKNLKEVYIVEASRSLKLTLQLCRPFISSKFWKKVNYVDPNDTASLSRFARQVGLAKQPL